MDVHVLKQRYNNSIVLCRKKSRSSVKVFTYTDSNANCLIHAGLDPMGVHYPRQLIPSTKEESIPSLSKFRSEIMTHQKWMRSCNVKRRSSQVSAESFCFDSVYFWKTCALCHNAQILCNGGL